MRLALACLGLLLGGCGGACAFSSRCNGNVLETCTQQTINRPAVLGSEDCGTKNASCVVLPHGQAACITNCDQSFVTHCEGDQLVSCDFSGDGGLVTSTDCFNAYPSYCDDFGCTCGGTCVDPGSGNAQCQPC